MRSIIVHLRDVTEAKVADFLSQHYPPMSGWAAPWTIPLDNFPVLFIDIYRDMSSEFEVEGWVALIECLGIEPSVSVNADVSGRYLGDEQVRDFACRLLSAFVGVAEDDYSEHFWTRDEIASRQLFDGHPFFDYKSFRLPKQ